MLYLALSTEIFFFAFIQFHHCTLKSRKTYHPQFRDTKLETHY